ncbi:MAG TPA: DUF4160 domain-containing protein [Verrucomicrobiae bacterium]
MPTVLRIRGFKFFFFSQEGNKPAHIHVNKGGGSAKFWLRPVKLEYNDGFKKQELRAIIEILERHEAELIQAWNEIE